MTRRRWLFWLLLPLPLLTAAFEASRPDGASWSPWRADMVDLRAIIGAAERLIAGESLYAAAGGAPFSMPPAVALLATPLAIAGPDAAQALWVLLTAALVTGVIVAPILARAPRGEARAREPGRGPALSGPNAAWIPLLAALAIALVQPIRDNVVLGQITVLTTCLVLADLLRPPLPRVAPRGLLTGIAAALALWPALVIVVQLCARRHRRAGAVAMISGAGLTLLAALIAPGDSARYWSVTLAGGQLAEDNALQRSTNVSIPAVLARTLGPEAAAAPAVALVLIVLAAAAVAGWLLIRDGWHTVGAATAGLGAVVSLPLAFGHAFVIAVPLAALVLLRPAPRMWQLAVAVLGLWVAVQPAARIDSTWVSAVTAVLIGAWFAVVIATTLIRSRAPTDAHAAP